MRGWLAAGLAVLSVCACRGGEEAAPRTAAPPIAKPAPPPQRAEPPPAYVGLWAARPDLCAEGAWVFDRDKVVTAGEVACAFRSVNETADGYQVTAECTAEGKPRAYQFTLEPTDPPDRMTVSRGPWAGPVSLARCPD